MNVNLLLETVTVRLISVVLVSPTIWCSAKGHVFKVTQYPTLRGFAPGQKRILRAIKRDFVSSEFAGQGAW